MKMKKLLALVLSAVMAVSMLAACGGGGATNILNRSEVEQIIYDAGVDIDVGSSSEVTRAIRYGAELIKERNYSSLSVSYLSNQLRDYIPADAYFNTAFAVSTLFENSGVSLELYTASMIAQLSDTVGLDADFSASAVEVTTKDNVRCTLIVVMGR